MPTSSRVQQASGLEALGHQSPPMLTSSCVLLGGWCGLAVLSLSANIFWSSSLEALTCTHALCPSHCMDALQQVQPGPKGPMTEEGKLGTCWEQVVISRYSGSQWFAVFASIPKRHFLGFSA